MYAVIERGKTAPERVDIVAENVPTGVSRRRPCRDPGRDHDAGDKSHKRVTSWK
jgi:hypothetical protein